MPRCSVDERSVRFGRPVLEPARQLLDRDFGFADADVDADCVRDRRSRGIAVVLPGLEVIDGEQEAAHDFVYLVTACVRIVGGTGVSRWSCLEPWPPAALACCLENLTSAGAVGWRARHLVPAIIGIVGVVAVPFLRPLV